MAALTTTTMNIITTTVTITDLIRSHHRISATTR